MGSFSIWHWLVVLVVVLVLFGGGGKLSRLMGDAARGINAFKKGLKEEPPQEAVSRDAEKAIETESADKATENVKRDETVKS